jgi:SAM-dependent methyltransferase
MTTIEYYNSYADKFKSRFPTLFEFSAPLNERNLPRVNTADYLLPKIAPESSFLDVGCGWGAFSDYLPSSVRYTGIDNSKAMLSFATPKENATFIQDDFHLLPFEDNSFDYILANESLNYANVENAHREIHRVLKPEGKFYSKMWLFRKPAEEALAFNKNIVSSIIGIENDLNVFGIQDLGLYQEELNKFFNHKSEAPLGFTPHSLDVLSLFKVSEDGTKLEWESSFSEEEAKEFRRTDFKVFAPVFCGWSPDSFFVCTKK